MQPDFLTEAGHILASTLDYNSQLVQVTRLMIPGLADHCAIFVVDEAGVVQQVAEASAYPDDERIIRARRSVPLVQGGILLEAIAGGHSRFSEVVTAQEGMRAELVNALGICSAMVVPLVARGRIFGAISTGMGRSGRHHTREQFRLLEELGRRAGLALDHARMYQQAQAAIGRTACLQRLTAALAGALEPEQVSEVVVSEGVAALGADGGAVFLLSAAGDYLEVMRAAGYRSDVVEDFQRFPLDADLPASEAARTGEPVFIESSEDYLRRYPSRTPAQGSGALVALPLALTGSKPIGAIG